MNSNAGFPIDERSILLDCPFGVAVAVHIGDPAEMGLHILRIVANGAKKGGLLHLRLAQMTVATSQEFVDRGLKLLIRDFGRALEASGEADGPSKIHLR